MKEYIHHYEGFNDVNDIFEQSQKITNAIINKEPLEQFIKIDN